MAVLQFVRLLTGIGLFPLLIHTIEKTAPDKAEEKEIAGESPAPVKPAVIHIFSYWRRRCWAAFLENGLGFRQAALLFSTEATDIMLLHIIRVIAAVSIMPQIIPCVGKLF